MKMAARRLLLAFLLFAMNAWAHAPYERRACTFIRQDGSTVFAVKHYVDGIIGRDPVAIEFRLADGAVIASTVRTRDTVALNRGPAGVDIYRFRSDWIPVAQSVQRFDGYALKDITTPAKQRLSPFIHTRSEWRSYAIPLGLTLVCVAAWMIVNKLPNGDVFRVLRMCGFGCISLAAVLLALLTFWASSASPFVFCILVVACVTCGFMMHASIVRLSRAKKVKVETNLV